MLLAAVQALTEFLPVSSSGHLALAPRVMDWPDQGRAIDVAVHVGSLFAVLLYFRGDVARMLRGLASLATRTNRLKRRIVVFLGDRRQVIDGVEILPLGDFLGELPGGGGG